MKQTAANINYLVAAKLDVPCEGRNAIQKEAEERQAQYRSAQDEALKEAAEFSAHIKAVVAADRALDDALEAEK